MNENLANNIEHLRGLLTAIQAETTPIDGHDDPGAITDCWYEVFETLNEMEVESVDEEQESGIQIVNRQYWTWLVNHDCPQEKQDKMHAQIESPFHGTHGKYLFFSKDRKELVELAKKLLVEYELHHAKTPTMLRGGRREYVLCLYDFDKHYEKEMEKYETDIIKYRYWKSDEATIKGVEEHELD